MTDETLKTVRQDFLAGCTYKSLAEKYGIPLSVLQKQGRKEGWYYLRREKAHVPDPPAKKETDGNGMRLRVAVDTIAEIIDKMAAEMRGSLENGDSGDIKQLKELTLAAKELAAVIRGLEGDDMEDEGNAVHIVLEGEVEKWAR